MIVYAYICRTGESIRMYMLIYEEGKPLLCSEGGMEGEERNGRDSSEKEQRESLFFLL